MLLPRWGVWLLSIAACTALFLSLSYASKLRRIQEQLALQSVRTQALADDARADASQALDLARDASTRSRQGEARLNEYTLQRSHLEQLAFDISRSWEANLLVELESSLRLAQQQAQLTGLADPLIAALRSAHQRMERTNQPRLIPVQSAIDSDLRRLTSATVTDTAGLLARIDKLVQTLPLLPLRNAVGNMNQPLAVSTPSFPAPLSPLEAVDLSGHAEAYAPSETPAAHDSSAQDRAEQTPASEEAPFWRRWPQMVWSGAQAQAQQLFRVQNIEHPDAVLLTQDQAFFLRENLSIQLLNARMGLLARQNDSARADLAQVQSILVKYFDLDAPVTQQALQILRQLHAHIQAVELPAITETLAALSNAANAPSPSIANALRTATQSAAERTATLSEDDDADDERTDAESDSHATAIRREEH